MHFDAYFPGFRGLGGRKLALLREWAPENPEKYAFQVHNRL
jgi:hypothetical protein